MLRFDHLVIAVRDLPGSAAVFQSLGFHVRPGGRHEGFGTRNAIVRFGLDYLELIAVEDEQLALKTSRGALVEFLKDHEMGPCAYALASQDLDGLGLAARRAGIEMGEPVAMQRRRPDGSLLSWRLLIPGGNQYFEPWPFFIQWDQPDGERLELEQPGQHANGAIGVARVDVAVHDLAGARSWYEALGLDPAGAGIDLGEAKSGDAEGPRSVTLQVRGLAETDDWLLRRGFPIARCSSHPLVSCLENGPLAGAIRFTGR
jgi:hypothetical protein